MGLVCKTKFEKAWIVASVVLLVVYMTLTNTGSGDVTPGRPFLAWLELSMIILSFPLGGLTLFGLYILTFWCDDCRNLQFLFDWPTLLVAGYIQWFWLLPEFLQSRQLTLLDLKRPLRAITANASPVAGDTTPASLSTTPTSLSTTPAPLSTTRAPQTNASPDTCAATLPAFDAAAFAPALTEFDEAGQTALDRVFLASPVAPAQASPASRVETIFPRVG
ncbi:MAG TPA: hypothetical protein VF656_12535 [Pyrinomonadaceae bacterium]|jgi:hypothetical protein